MSRVSTQSALDRGARPQDIRAPGIRPEQVRPVIENLGPVQSDAALALEGLQGLASVAQAAAGLVETTRRRQLISDEEQSKAESKLTASLQFDMLRAETSDDLTKTQSQIFALSDPTNQRNAQSTLNTTKARLRTEGKSDQDTDYTAAVTEVKTALLTKDTTKINQALESVGSLVETFEIDQENFASRFADLQLDAQSNIEFNEGKKLNANLALVDGQLTNQIRVIEQSGIHEGIYLESTRTRSDPSIAYDTAWRHALTRSAIDILVGTGLTPSQAEQEIKKDVFQRQISNQTNFLVDKWTKEDSALEAAEAEDTAAKAPRVIGAWALSSLDGGVIRTREEFITKAAISGIDGGSLYEEFISGLVGSLNSASTNPLLREDWMGDANTMHQLRDAILDDEFINNSLLNVFATQGGVRVATAAVADYRSNLRKVAGPASLLNPASVNEGIMNTVADQQIVSDPRFSPYLANTEAADRSLTWQELRDVATITSNSEDARTANDGAYMAAVLESIKAEAKTAGPVGTGTFNSTPKSTPTTVGGLMVAMDAKRLSTQVPQMAAAMGDMLGRLSQVDPSFEISEFPEAQAMLRTYDVLMGVNNVGTGLSTPGVREDLVTSMSDILTGIVNEPDPSNGEKIAFDTVRFVWENAIPSIRLDMAEGMSKELFDLEGATQTDRILVLEFMDTLLRDPQAAGTNAIESFRAQLATTRDALEVTDAVSPAAAQTAMSATLIAAGIENPTKLAPSAQRLMYGFAIGHAEQAGTFIQGRSLRKEDLRAGFDEFVRFVGFPWEDANGVIQISRPENILMGDQGSSFVKRNQAMTRILQESVTNQTNDFILTLELGSPDVRLKQINAQRAEAPGDLVPIKESFGLDVRTGLDVNAGINRMAMQITDETGRTDVYWLSDKTGNQWLETNNTFDARAKANAIESSLREHRQEQLRLEQSIAFKEKAGVRLQQRATGFGTSATGNTTIQAALTRDKNALLIVTEFIAEQKDEWMNQLMRATPTAASDDAVAQISLQIDTWLSTVPDKEADSAGFIGPLTGVSLGNIRSGRGDPSFIRNLNTPGTRTNTIFRGN